MTISSADIKRQIIMSADSSEIKGKINKKFSGLSDDDFIEIGNDLEALSKTRGWIWVEAFMIKRMNLVGLALSDDENKDHKGIARGFIELMQTIQLMIQQRDEILARLNEEKPNVTQGVSKEKTD